MTTTATITVTAGAAAIRPIRRMDDEFFLPGDYLSYHQDENLVFSYHVKEDDDEEEDINDSGTMNLGGNDDGDDNNHQNNKNHDDTLPSSPYHQSYPYDCPNCQLRFDSIPSFEEHYISTHIHQCQHPTCRRNNVDNGVVFPNDHLLELHIYETHDVFFQIMLERSLNNNGSDSNHKNYIRPKLYKCLVINCKESFYTDKQRLQHLIQCHNYPKWFRFHSRIAKNKNNKKEKKQVKEEKQRNNRTTKGSRKDTSIMIMSDNQNHQHLQDTDIPSATATTTALATASSTASNITPTTNITAVASSVDEDKKRRRRERRIAKNSQIPCKFYHSKRGYCSRGDKCMFLHGGNHQNNTKENHYRRMDMDDVPSNHDMETRDTSKPKKEYRGLLDDDDDDNDDGEGNNEEESSLVMMCETENDTGMGNSNDHETLSNVNNCNTMMDCDVNELSKQMKNQVHVSIPQNIRFGRRRRK